MGAQVMREKPGSTLTMARKLNIYTFSSKRIDCAYSVFIFGIPPLRTAPRARATKQTITFEMIPVNRHTKKKIHAAN